MKKKIFTLSVLLCVAFVSAQTFARRVYVKLHTDAAAWNHITPDEDNLVITLPEGSTDFVSNVLSQLQAGDEVWVAKGEYENGGKLTLMNHEDNNWTWGNIVMYGGFEGTENDVAERIIQDKDANGLIEAWEFVNETNFKGKGNSEANASGFQLIHLGSNSVLDGITISDNYYKANQAAGGIVDKTATIRNCIIRDLTAQGTGTVNGGGLYVTGGGVESCLFESCIATGSNTSFGGALLIYGVNDNSAEIPTGYLKNSVLRNCSSSASTSRGGAIFGKGGVIIENCIVYNNYAGTNGAAFYFHKNGDANKQVNRIIGTTIVNNQSNAYPLFPECQFLEIYNTVSWGNARADGKYVEIIRCTAGGTTAYPYWDTFAYHGTVRDMNNKNSEYMQILVTGAIGDSSTDDNNPKFKKATSFTGIATNESQLEEIRKANWTLLEDSPLINAGVDEPTNKLTGYDAATLPAVFSGKDILGKTRVSKFDIGAYEYIPEGPGTGCKTVSENPFAVYSNSGNIVISNLNEKAEVILYSISGIELNSMHTSASTVTIPVSGKGLYIVSVKMNNKLYSQKVAL